MAVKVRREGDEVVLRIKAGPRAGGLARFLEQAAIAFENGKLLPTNPNPNGNIAKAADEIRTLARNIHKANNP